MPARRLRLYRLGLAVVSVLYVGAEILFNISLLEVVSRSDPAPGTVHDVEEFGRRASSTGFSLFVAGLFIGTGFIVQGHGRWVFAVVLAVCISPFVLTEYYRHTLLLVVAGGGLVAVAGKLAGQRPGLGSLMSLIGLLMATWPAFYNGKVAMIDHYLVDRSSGVERLVAGHVGLLRRALVLDAVEIHDVALSELGGADRPEAKAFLVTLGPLAIYANALQEWASGQGNIQRLVRCVAANRNVVDVGVKYRQYLRHREEFIRDVYAPYSEAAKQYIERAPVLAQRAAAAWRDLQLDIDNGWKEYTRASNRFAQVHVDMAERGLAQKLRRFFTERALCHRNRGCLGRLDRRYERDMRRLFQDPPPWTVFCEEASLVDKVIRKRPNGLSVNVNPLAMFTTDYRCSTTPREVGLTLAFSQQETFEKDAANPAGLPFGMTENAWRGSARLAAHVRAGLERKHGLSLPPGWSLNDQTEFYSAYRKRADDEAMEGWRAQSKQLFGAVVPVGLSLDGLTRTPAIQKRLRQDLGADYVDGFVFSWSEEAYVRNVVHPLIECGFRRI